MKSSAEIAQDIANNEQAINKAADNRDTVKMEINRLRREIHAKQIQIKNLEDSLIKAECVVRELKTNHNILKDAFWRAKDEGI
jgi:uncharacterized coiled-coil DUF342 family protein